MKVTLHSTSRIVNVNGVDGRVWEGQTDSGIEVVAVITRIAAPTSADLSQFEAELQEMGGALRSSHPRVPAQDGALMRALTQERFRMATETPKDRVRASILLTVLPLIAERILQHDKANPAFKLSDLRSDDERAIYFAEVEELLSPERRAERILRFNQVRGLTNALADKEQEDVHWQARQDVSRYDPQPVRRGNFGMVPAGRCYVCTLPIAAGEAAVLELSATLKADVHAGCCLNNSRFEMTAQFAFRVKGGAR